MTTDWFTTFLAFFAEHTWKGVFVAAMLYCGFHVLCQCATRLGVALLKTTQVLCRGHAPATQRIVVKDA